MLSKMPLCFIFRIRPRIALLCVAPCVWLCRMIFRLLLRHLLRSTFCAWRAIGISFAGPHQPWQSLPALFPLHFHAYAEHIQDPGLLSFLAWPAFSRPRGRGRGGARPAGGARGRRGGG